MTAQPAETLGVPRPRRGRRGNGPVRALNTEEVALAASAARHLAGSLRALAMWAPPEARKVRALAAMLGIDQSLAQRALAGAQPETPEILTLMRVPGVEGLRLLAQAARERGCPGHIVEGLEMAAGRFGEVISLLAGSHARLRARVEATLGEDRTAGVDRPEHGQEGEREGMFRAAAELAGVWEDFYGAISMMAPQSESPGTMTGLTASVHAGVRGRPGGMPFSVTFADRLDARDEGGPSRVTRVLGDSGTGPGGTLLTAFSTDPLPVVTANAGAQSVTQVVDPEALYGANAVDVAVATRRGPMPIPRMQATPTQSAAVQVRTPSRRLVLDFWVHRDLAPVRMPQVGAFIYQPGMPLDPALAWYNRLPGTPVLQVLGEGLGNAGSDAWVRLGELTGFLFDLAGWRAEEFIGFRCDVRYPVWCTAYVLWMDYSEGGQ